MNGEPRGFWGVVERTFFPLVPAARLGAVRALVCAVALYDLWLYAGVVLADARLVDAGGPLRPWSPLLLAQVLGIRPIGVDTANLLLLVGTVALLAGMLGLASRVSCAVGAIAFFWTTCLAYSFGKPHHDKVALAFAMMALPFAPVGAACSLDAWLRGWWQRRRGLAAAPPPQVSGMPIRITQLTLAIGYCGAGLSKLLIGGPDWFNGYTLQGIMLGHDSTWSRVFAADVTLARLQSIGVVVVQAAFPLVFVWPASRWFFLPMATLFHLMTWATMDTGPYMRVWLLLPVFVELERAPATLHGWLRGGGLRAVAVAVAAAGAVLLVGSVADDVLPQWGIAAALAWLAFTVVRARPLAPPTAPPTSG